MKPTKFEDSVSSECFLEVVWSICLFIWITGSKEESVVITCK